MCLCPGVSPPTTQIVLSVLALLWAWAAAFCRLLWGGEACGRLGRGRLVGRVDKAENSTSTVPTTLGWPGIPWWQLDHRGSWMAVPVQACVCCVLGRVCLLPLACGPQSLAAPQGKMMSGFWGFHLVCGIYLLDSPQPWLPLWGLCVLCPHSAEAEVVEHGRGLWSCPRGREVETKTPLFLSSYSFLSRSFIYSFVLLLRRIETIQA